MYNKDFNKKKFLPIKILAIVGMVVLFTSVAGWVVMFLWNAIIPDVTGWKPLTFWQAVGLLVLAKILFGGIGRKSRGRRNRFNHMRKRWMHMDAEEKKEFKNKWMHMDSEEKKAFKQKWKNYCKGKNEEM